MILNNNTDIILPGSVFGDYFEQEKKDIAFATNRAKQFMQGLFGGSVKATCKCGQKIAYKNDQLKCSNCGKLNDRVEWVDDYDDRYIKTTIDTVKREFELAVNNG